MAAALQRQLHQIVAYLRKGSGRKNILNLRIANKITEPIRTNQKQVACRRNRSSGFALQPGRIDRCQPDPTFGSQKNPRPKRERA
jgi:hypothetical protein